MNITIFISLHLIFYIIAIFFITLKDTRIWWGLYKDRDSIKYIGYYNNHYFYSPTTKSLVAISLLTNTFMLYNLNDSVNFWDWDCRVLHKPFIGQVFAYLGYRNILRCKQQEIILLQSGDELSKVINRIIKFESRKHKISHLIN
jgi:hypothetical protein